MREDNEEQRLGNNKEMILLFFNQGKPDILHIIPIIIFNILPYIQGHCAFLWKVDMWVWTLLLFDVECRIIKVDLKFPPKPIVSAAAKDVISQVKNVNIPSLLEVNHHWNNYTQHLLHVMARCSLKIPLNGFRFTNY